MQISIIVAVAKNNVIGKDNSLIWYLPADLQHFKRLTMGCPIIMGRKTFESIGKALPGRTSVIVTRNKTFHAENCVTVHSLEEALEKVQSHKEVFIIGGADIYRQALEKADKLYLTKVHESFDGDTFFPEIDMAAWQLIEEKKMQADDKNKYSYSFLTYIRKQQ